MRGGSKMIRTAVNAAAGAAMGEPEAKRLWLDIYSRSAGAETSGERGLMLEIMEHTRRGLAGKPGSEVRRECERWLREREPDRAFSFEWICGVFDWNPEKWRREMLAAAGRNGGTRKVWRRLAHRRIERRRERR